MEHRSVILMFALILLLSGCVSTQDKKGIDPASLLPIKSETPLNNQVGFNAEPPVARESSSGPLFQPGISDAQVFLGNDRVVRAPEARDPIQFFGESVSLNFEEVPVTQVVHVILGEILDLDYAIEHPLEGNITLRTRSPVEQNKLLSILESLLVANGAVMIRDENDRFFVGPGASMSNFSSGVEGMRNQGAGFSNVVIPLQYISATEMAEILAPIAPESSFVRVDPRRNLLVLSGTRQQMDGWLSMIATFDIDTLKEMSVGVFPLQYAPVQEVHTGLVALLGNELIANPADGPESGLVNIIPVERMNALIVVTARSHYLEKIKLWVSRLDRPIDNYHEKNLYVYPVQNGSAEHLAELVSNLLGDNQSSVSRNSGVSPGMTQTRASENDRSPIDGDMGQQSSTSTSSFSDYQLDNNVKVVADGQSNALLIYARQADYSKVEQALKRLDIAPVQVLIEASIIEVSLNDELRYGLEWFLKENLGSGWRGDALLNLSDEPLGARTPGFSFTVTNPSGVVRAVVSALADESLVNVISNPSVMVLDNHTATIQVGNQQPIRSSQTVSDGGNVTSSIQYKDTGVMLSVTPSVNAGGMVNMEIDQAVTDVGQQDAATGQRSFLERNIKSRVAIRSGETVVLGGLIRDNTSNTRSGLPVLHDLPVVGNLFGSTSNITNRTELLVMITPRVLTNEQDLRDISREIRSRMIGLDLDENQPLMDE